MREPIHKNNNTVMFTFDSIVDIEIGLVMKVKEDFFDLRPRNPIIDYSFLESMTVDELKKFRLLFSDPPFSKCFTDKVNEDMVKQIRESYLKNQYKEIIKVSPYTDLKRLIPTFYRSNIVKSIIVCRNTDEYDMMSKLFGDMATIIKVDDYKEVNVRSRSVARLIVANIYDCIKFKGVSGIHIAVLNYANNFVIMKDDNGKERKTLNLLASIPLWDRNDFDIMEPYNIKEEY